MFVRCHVCISKNTQCNLVETIWYTVSFIHWVDLFLMISRVIDSTVHLRPSRPTGLRCRHRIISLLSTSIGFPLQIAYCTDDIRVIRLYLQLAIISRPFGARGGGRVVQIEYPIRSIIIWLVCQLQLSIIQHLTAVR